MKRRNSHEINGKELCHQTKRTYGNKTSKQEGLFTTKTWEVSTCYTKYRNYGLQLIGEKRRCTIHNTKKLCTVFSQNCNGNVKFWTMKEKLHEILCQHNLYSKLTYKKKCWIPAMALMILLVCTKQTIKNCRWRSSLEIMWLHKNMLMNRIMNFLWPDSIILWQNSFTWSKQQICPHIAF